MTTWTSKQAVRLERLTHFYSAKSAKALLDMSFDRAALAARPLPYERLDQLTLEVLMGVR